MYTVRWYKGDYITRQKLANRDKAAVYIEHHFNGGSATATYALANVGTNAGRTSKALAGTYVENVCKAFGTKPANNSFATDGVSVGGYRLRGNNNLVHTDMPAILCEPLFASNPDHAAIIRSEDGQNKLAECLVSAIKHIIPEGLVAFSVGHKYRASKPFDLGVPLANRPAHLTEREDAEAVYAEIVLKKAEALLNA
jgi:hypothetical protein